MFSTEFGYEQVSGKLYDGNGLIGVGWAGHEAGKNNPNMQGVQGVGPIPKGIYTIGDPVDSTQLGPLAFPLTPATTNVMFGRSGFFLHGAAFTNPAMSSDGCIIQQHTVREYVETKIGGTPEDAPVRQLTVY